MNANRMLNNVKSIAEDMKLYSEMGESLQGLIDDLYSFLQLDINWNPDEIKYLKKNGYTISKAPGCATKKYRGANVTFEKYDWNNYSLRIDNKRNKLYAGGDTDDIGSAKTTSEDFLLAWEEYKDDNNLKVNL